MAVTRFHPLSFRQKTRIMRLVERVDGDPVATTLIPRFLRRSVRAFRYGHAIRCRYRIGRTGRTGVEPLESIMSVRLPQIESLRDGFGDWLASIENGTRTAPSELVEESDLSELLLAWMHDGGAHQAPNYEAFIRSVVLIVIEVASGRILFRRAPIRISSLVTDWWMLAASMSHIDIADSGPFPR